jgi:benzoyl-CoA reductase/2-hydroxyglutaryl-CoA dehydratase subunit BcrC/BadD/HgdB
LEAFEKMKRHYRERSSAAKEWKQHGGKVVGYITHNVPEELITAAGLFPLRMSGNPLEATPVGDETMEYFFDPSVRSIYNMLLTDKFDFLDFLVIPHSNDSVFKLYYYLMEVKRREPSLNLPDFYLLDMLYTKWFATSVYNRKKVMDFKERLEALAGRSISKEDLTAAISVTNENKRLLNRISDLRKEHPPRISGSEALQIFGSSLFMNKADHNKLLEAFLSETDSLTPKDGIRVSIEGSQIDHLQFYELVESCGATIVTESHSWGDRYVEAPVDPSFGPIEAIAEKYHLHSPSPRAYPNREEERHCLDIAKDADVQGTIFFLLEWDDAPAWDYPVQKKILEENGIPTLCFRMQKYLLSDTERMKSEIESFVDSIRKR